MADLLNSTGAEVRTADTLLRACGGRAVQLRMPAPGVPGDASEQLGLAVPEFQDVDLAPVVVLASNAKGTRALLVSATAVGALAGSLAFSAASVLFQTACGVLLDGVLFEVSSVVESESRGVPYMYRVTLRVPAALTL